MRRKSVADVTNLVNQLNNLDSIKSKLLTAELQDQAVEVYETFRGDAMQTAALLELRIDSKYRPQLEALMARSEHKLFTFFVKGTSTAGFVVETTTADVLFVCTFSASRAVPADAA